MSEWIKGTLVYNGKKTNAMFRGLVKSWNAGTLEDEPVKEHWYLIYLKTPMVLDTGETVDVIDARGLPHPKFFGAHSIEITETVTLDPNTDEATEKEYSNPSVRVIDVSKIDPEVGNHSGSMFATRVREKRSSGALGSATEVSSEEPAAEMGNDRVTPDGM